MRLQCRPHAEPRWLATCVGREVRLLRSFGLFAPRALGQTSAAIFAILGQSESHAPSLAKYQLPGTTHLTSKRRSLRLLSKDSNRKIWMTASH